LCFFSSECDSQCSAEEAPSPLEIAPPPHVQLTITGSLVPVQKSSPERRHQKEIVAGEERPKFLTVVPPKTEENNAQGEIFHFHSQQIFFLFSKVFLHFSLES
jgi:hypothetical protein